MRRINISEESLTGVLLIVASVTALVWANSPWSESYHEVLEAKIGIEGGSFGLTQSLHTWINDGLMALFFFSVGLEIKGELVGGELNTTKKALLPVGAAIGGMLLPALIFTFINLGASTINGWGIPMATDIAFAIVLLTLFKDRLSPALIVFITALAIVDDLGSIIVIAVFYSSETDLYALGIGLLSFLVLITGNKMGIRSPYFYLIIGIAGLWYFFIRSGVHATLSGVLIALAVPARTTIDGRTFAANAQVLLNRFIQSCPSGTVLLTSEQVDLMERAREEISKAETPLQHWKDTISPLVNFIVLPLFALSNAGITIGADSFGQVFAPVGIGIFMALWLGKPIGILLATFLMTRLGISNLPTGVDWKQMLAATCLAGIGFTVSLFISELAFDNETITDGAKLAVLLASFTAAISGTLLFSTLKKRIIEIQ